MAILIILFCIAVGVIIWVKKSKKRDFTTYNNIYCSDTKERFNSYSDYLKGKHWKKVRELILKRDKHRCKHRYLGLFRCRATTTLEIHHKKYKVNGKYIVGEEHKRKNRKHLVTLCRKHHRKKHKKL